MAFDDPVPAVSLRSRFCRLEIETGDLIEFPFTLDYLFDLPGNVDNGRRLRLRVAPRSVFSVSGQMTKTSRQIRRKWTVGKIPTGEADSPQPGVFRSGQPPVMAIFKCVISRRNGFRDLPWHTACVLSPRGNWGIHANHDSKAASTRGAEWESAVETVMGAMQGPIQLRRFKPLTVSGV